MVMRVWLAVRWWLLRSTAHRLTVKPNECAILELSGLGSPPTICTLTKEVKGKNPVVVFLAKTKATIDRMKGFQHKLGFSQGIIVPSDGKSGGLVMLW